MTLAPDHRARWLANLEAAGIEPDEETSRRIEAALAERVTSLHELLERLDERGLNPDYLRDTIGEERPGGRA